MPRQTSRSWMTKIHAILSLPVLPVTLNVTLMRFSMHSWISAMQTKSRITANSLKAWKMLRVKL